MVVVESASGNMGMALSSFLVEEVILEQGGSMFHLKVPQKSPNGLIFFLLKSAVSSSKNNEILSVDRD